MFQRLMQTYSRTGLPCRPALEQLESRLAPSVTAPPTALFAPPPAPPHHASPAPAPTDAHTQALLAIFQAVRNPVARVDAPLPPAAGTAPAFRMPSPSITVDAPPVSPFDHTIIALPVEPVAPRPTPTENPPTGSPFEEARAVEPETPRERPTVIVLAGAEEESEMFVPATAEFHAGTVCAPAISLAEPAPVVEPAKDDHLPALAWMIGMAGLLSLRAEHRRLRAASC